MPSNTIMYNSDVTRRLTKGYGSTTQPIYVKSDGTIDVITAANLASFVDGAHQFVRLNGDTMTGHLIIRRNGESAIIVSDGVHYTDNTFRFLLTLNGSTGAQGIWSSGYSDGTTFTSDGKYLLYRDTSGNVKLYGNADTATKWATAQTLTIGSTGKSVDGSANVSWSKAEILGSSTSAYFYRGDQTWSNTLVNSFWAGTNGDTTAERQVGAQSGAGQIYMYSQASTTGNRGIYVPAHGSGGARAVLTVDTNNQISFADYYTGTQTRLAYSQSGLAASAITWLTCWNGYELRAISKAEMATAVDSSHKWVRLAGDTMTGLLKITINSNTFTMGSQNTSFTHLYNSANIPFIFNNSVLTTTGNLGNSSYPFNNLYIGKTNGAGIYCVGSKSTNRMIRFIVNSNDAYGNGISIGGGGQAIIGGGESADTACGQAGTAGAETMWICNDGIIEFYPNLQNGWTTSYRNYVNTNGHFYSVAVHSAVWNDYAECRIGDTVEPGRVVTEQINGTMTTANKRLMPGCKIISDTYGMLIGETQIAKTPIAVSGRVLVYPYQPKEKYKLGAAVCSAPGGTVDIMTREEIMKYPERIIGTVSEIPDYDIWYAGQRDDTSGGGAIPITVNGRIWIYVR